MHIRAPKNLNPLFIAAFRSSVVVLVISRMIIPTTRALPNIPQLARAAKEATLYGIWTPPPSVPMT